MSEVSLADHVQHLLRYEDGRFVKGSRGHRVVSTLQNTVLVQECCGKGFAVVKSTMRRIGSRVGGSEVISKRQLRAIMADEDVKRTVLGQIMSVGRDVRSTPMHWRFEGKKLDCGVKHLSWVPPWVKPYSGAPNAGHGFVEDKHMVRDGHGLGRIPSTWFTINSKYNSCFDIQRLNTEDKLASAAVGSLLDEHKAVRFDFISNAPDIATYMACRDGDSSPLEE